MRDVFSFVGIVVGLTIGFAVGGPVGWLGGFVACLAGICLDAAREPRPRAGRPDRLGSPPPGPRETPDQVSEDLLRRIDERRRSQRDHNADAN